MADEPKPDEGEVLELTEDQIVGPNKGEEDQLETGDDDEEVIVSFGDEAAPASDASAPEWVRDLRKRARELERENAELKKGKAPQVPELGPKPTLEDCDYDEEKFETKFNAWLDDKSAHDRAKTEATQAEEKAQERWQADLAEYGDQKTKLAVKDFASAEEEVLSLLTPTQQAILIQGAEDKAKFVYALGKNPEKLRQLASITDPIKFAFAAARLEGQAKMERKRAATSPESDIRGSAPLGKTSDKQLERLENEAERTGVRTKLIAYKKSKGLI